MAELVGRSWARALSFLLALAISACTPPKMAMREPLYSTILVDPLAGTTLGSDIAARDEVQAALSSFSSGRLGEGLRRLDSVERSSNVSAPELHPLYAIRGLIYLAAGDRARAGRQIDEALARNRESVPGLVARAAQSYALGDDEATLRGVADVMAVMPEHRGARTLEQRSRARLFSHRLEMAREAERLGDVESARRHIDSAAAMEPGNVQLRRRQATLAVQVGDDSAAIEAYGALTDLVVNEPANWIGLGEAHLRVGDHRAARAAFEHAAGLPGGLEQARARIDRLRSEERQQIVRDPQVERMASEPAIDRAALAAMIGAQLNTVRRLPSVRRPVVVTDVGNSWARPQIQDLVAAGIFEVYDNHTFRPESTVTRVMLAQVAAEILRSYRQAGWLTERPLPTVIIADLPQEHLSYPSVLSVLSYGLMTLSEDGRFRTSEPVSGSAAGDVLTRLAELVR